MSLISMTVLVCPAVFQYGSDSIGSSTALDFANTYRILRKTLITQLSSRNINCRLSFVEYTCSCTIQTEIKNAFDIFCVLQYNLYMVFVYFLIYILARKGRSSTVYQLSVSINT